MLNDVIPNSPSKNTPQGIHRYSKLIAQFCSGTKFRKIIFPDKSNISLSKLGVFVPLSTKMIPPVFRHRILNIVFHCAKEKMRFCIAASRVVTMMKYPHSFWNLSHQQFPCDSVAIVKLPIEAYLAVSGVSKCSSPLPATSLGRFVDSIPKSILEFGRCIKDCTHVSFFAPYGLLALRRSFIVTNMTKDWQSQ